MLAHFWSFISYCDVLYHCAISKRMDIHIVHWGGGGDFHINLHGMCHFSGYHFSAKIPEQGIKIDQKLFAQEQSAIVFPIVFWKFLSFNNSETGC